jgi:hypothetical protein
MHRTTIIRAKVSAADSFEHGDPSHIAAGSG